MPTLLVTRPLPEEVIDAVQAAFDVTVRQETDPMTAEEMVEALGRYDAILPTLRDPLGRATFEAAPGIRTKLLANFGVGYNHIDVDAARKAGIVVTNTPGAVTEATADIALTLILMTARRAGEGERLVRRGEWTGWHPTQLLGMHLGGKTLGVVGMGRIGKAIARRAVAGLGMSVIFHNRSFVENPGVEARQVDSLKDVASEADVVVLAVPATAQTRRMIDADFLKAMRPHGILVNIARGDVVDEAALIAALERGEIGGAGLDVYENEPEVPAALRAMENVTLLPHLGTSAHEVRVEMGLMAAENLLAWAEGRTPPNVV